MTSLGASSVILMIEIPFSRGNSILTDNVGRVLTSIDDLDRLASLELTTIPIKANHKAIHGKPPLIDGIREKKIPVPRKHQV